MNDHVVGLRRLCVLVRGAPGSQEDLVGLLGRAAFEARMERLYWQPQPGGHVLGAFPPGVDEPTVLASLILTVRRLVGETDGCCLTIAVHEGLTYLTAIGLSGPAVDFTHDLLAAVATPDIAPITVIVPRHLYDELTSEAGVIAVPAQTTSLIVGGNPVPVWIETP